ncbi:MAG: hypothetical protein ACK42E_03835, partial [Candidatus Bipolaricaulaceae bacterium]
MAKISRAEGPGEEARQVGHKPLSLDIALEYPFYDFRRTVITYIQLSFPYFIAIWRNGTFKLSFLCF